MDIIKNVVHIHIYDFGCHVLNLVEDATVSI